MTATTTTTATTTPSAPAARPPGIAEAAEQAIARLGKSQETPASRTDAIAALQEQLKLVPSALLRLSLQRLRDVEDVAEGEGRPNRPRADDAEHRRQAQVLADLVVRFILAIVNWIRTKILGLPAYVRASDMKPEAAEEAGTAEGMLAEAIVKELQARAQKEDAGYQTREALDRANESLRVLEAAGAELEVGTAPEAARARAADLEPALEQKRAEMAEAFLKSSPIGVSSDQGLAKVKEAQQKMGELRPIIDDLSTTKRASQMVADGATAEQLNRGLRHWRQVADLAREQIEASAIRNGHATPGAAVGPTDGAPNRPERDRRG